MSEPYIIYLVVRKDLKMGTGKIAAQCGHAIQYLLELCPKPIWNIYKKEGSTKVCLKVDTDAEFQELKRMLGENNVMHRVVIDAGRTQIEPNTETCLGIGPVHKESVQKFVQNLKLL